MRVRGPNSSASQRLRFGGRRSARPGAGPCMQRCASGLAFIPDNDSPHTSPSSPTMPLCLSQVSSEFPVPSRACDSLLRSREYGPRPPRISRLAHGRRFSWRATASATPACRPSAAGARAEPMAAVHDRGERFRAGGPALHSREESGAKGRDRVVRRRRLRRPS